MTMITPTTLLTFGASLLLLANTAVAVNHSPTRAALSPRQSVEPSLTSCNTICAPFVDLGEKCAADNLTIGQSSCGCSPTDEEIVGNCYECMARLGPAVAVASSEGETPSILAQDEFNAYLEVCSLGGVTLPSVILSGTAPVQVPGTSSAGDSSQSTISGFGSSPTSGSSKNSAIGMHEEMIVSIGYPLFLLLLGVLQVI